ncbi:H3 protein, partial [Ramphastos sulfuratus]|nr:H3 protein [Ramphastos sulfuratus]
SPPPPTRKKLLRPRKKRSELLLPAAAIRGLLRDACGPREGLEVQGEAAAALRAGCEAQLLALFEDLGLCALHAKRISVHAADLNLVRCLRLGQG